MNISSYKRGDTVSFPAKRMTQRRTYKSIAACNRYLHTKPTAGKTREHIFIVLII